MATLVFISIEKYCVKASEQYLISDMRNFSLEKFVTALRNDLSAANLNSIDSAHDALANSRKCYRQRENKFVPLKKASGEKSSV